MRGAKNEKVKKIIAGLGIMMIIGASSLSIEVFADEMARKLSAEEELLIEPRADEIGWEYKTVGNKVYRRMYNYTKKEWIGEWEFVGYV